MSGLDDLSDLSKSITSVAPEVTDLPQFIRERLDPSLNRTRHDERLALRADILAAWQAFVQRWKIPDRHLANQIKRVEGMKYLPALILQNPSEEEGLPYDSMAVRARTFLWLNKTLNPLGLNLRDICTINIFPFITKTWLMSQSPTDRERAVRESLDLTVQFFKAYQLDTVISCQCLCQKAPEWLAPVIDHPLVKALSSTVSDARFRRVKRVQFAGHTINVIQAFHPSYIFQAPTAKYETDRQQLLSSLLTNIYAHCQEWKKQCIIADIEHTLRQLQKEVSIMCGSITKYQDLEQQFYQLSNNTCRFVYTSYSDEGADNGVKAEFSLQTWSKVMRFFLSTLPSKSLTLDMGNEEPRLTNIFPTRVMITSETKRFVVDLLKDMVHIDELEH